MLQIFHRWVVLFIITYISLLWSYLAMSFFWIYQIQFVLLAGRLFYSIHSYDAVCRETVSQQLQFVCLYYFLEVFFFRQSQILVAGLTTLMFDNSVASFCSLQHAACVVTFPVLWVNLIDFQLDYWGTWHRCQRWGLIVELRNLVTSEKTHWSQVGLEPGSLQMAWPLLQVH